jgi:hypothetical protein
MKSGGKHKEVDIYKYLVSTLETLAEQYLPEDVWGKYMQVKKAIEKKTGLKLEVAKPNKTEADTVSFKQHIDPEDLFVRPHKDPTKRMKCQTIFRDPLACLKYCTETAEKLLSFKKDYWDDTEFGPTPEDPHGSESLYAVINNIVPGMPEVSNVIWSRPDEILERTFQRHT